MTSYLKRVEVQESCHDGIEADGSKDAKNIGRGMRMS